MMDGFFSTVQKNMERKEAIEIALEFVEKVLQREVFVVKWLHQNTENLTALMEKIDFQMTFSRKVEMFHFQPK